MLDPLMLPLSIGNIVIDKNRSFFLCFKRDEMFLLYIPHLIKTHEKRPKIVKISKKSCFLNFKRGQGNLGRLVPGRSIYRLLFVQT